MGGVVSIYDYSPRYRSPAVRTEPARIIFLPIIQRGRAIPSTLLEAAAVRMQERKRRRLMGLDNGDLIDFGPTL